MTKVTLLDIQEASLTIKDVLASIQAIHNKALNDGTSNKELYHLGLALNELSDARNNLLTLIP